MHFNVAIQFSVFTQNSFDRSAPVREPYLSLCEKRWGDLAEAFPEIRGFSYYYYYCRYIPILQKIRIWIRAVGNEGRRWGGQVGRLLERENGRGRGLVTSLRQWLHSSIKLRHWPMEYHWPVGMPID
jgi:hypothetical protein